MEFCFKTKVSSVLFHDQARIIKSDKPKDTIIETDRGPGKFGVFKISIIYALNPI